MSVVSLSPRSARWFVTEQRSTKSKQTNHKKCPLFKSLLPGDTITSVNKIMNDPKKMLEECRDKQLLKLTVYRERTPAKSSVQLNASAAEFVPGTRNSLNYAPPQEIYRLPPLPPTPKTR